MFGMIKTLFFTSIILASIFVLLFAYLCRDEFLWAAKIKICRFEREYFYPTMNKGEKVATAVKDKVTVFSKRLKKAGKDLTGNEN